MGETNRLRVILAEQRIRQRELAERAGITPTTLSLIVAQKTTPTLPVARKIAKALGKSIEEIWPDEE